MGGIRSKLGNVADKAKELGESVAEVAAEAGGTVAGKVAAAGGTVAERAKEGSFGGRCAARSSETQVCPRIPRRVLEPRL